MLDPQGRRRAARWLLTVMLVAAMGCAGSRENRSDTGPTGPFSFWPPAPDEPRIQFLRSFSRSSDVEKEQTVLDEIIFGSESQALPITKPYGVAMWNGRIYVCDITNPAVVILDLAQEQTRLMVTTGVEQMAQPTDIAIADDGTKYVVDRRLGRIFVFDAGDRHIITFGEDGLVPVGVAVRGDELFVPDFETQSVLVLDRRTGAERRSIGGPGGEDGQFVRPLGIDTDADGGIFVSDVIRGRLQKFDEQGELLFGLGQIADSPGSFVRPKHIAVDAEGILYVVDAAFQNVQMFNAEGELLMFFGGAGDFPGAMNLPAGIAVSDAELEHFVDAVHPAFQPRRLVLVTNQFGAHKVAAYALGELRAGHTVEELLPSTAALTPPAPTPPVLTPPANPADPPLGSLAPAPTGPDVPELTNPEDD